MKSFLVALTTLFSSLLYAQDSTASDPVTDISIFVIDRIQGYNNPLMWVTHTFQNDVFLEGRMGFDWENTAAIIAGYSFKKSNFTVTPKAGFLFSTDSLGYNGPTFEVNYDGKVKKFRYFGMEQLAIAFGDNPNFLYHYTEVGFKISFAQINFAGQVYYPLDTEKPFTDIGPQVVFRIKTKEGEEVYFKPWFTIDPGHEEIKKFIIGVGYHF